jgi:hypothetical protein
MSHIFHAPSEWLCRRTSAKTRRAINFWLLVFWIFPGIAIWLLFRNVIWFIGFMSIYAIWTGHLGALAAETPVEEETPGTQRVAQEAERGATSSPGRDGEAIGLRGVRNSQPG